MTAYRIIILNREQLYVTNNILAILTLERILMITSYSNVHSAIVLNVNEGAVGGVVTISVASGDIKLESYLTMSSIRELGLSSGRNCKSMISSSNLIVDTSYSRLTRHKGIVTTVEEGAVSAIVQIEAYSNRFVSNCLISLVRDCGFCPGAYVYFGVNPFDVKIAIQ